VFDLSDNDRRLSCGGQLRMLLMLLLLTLRVVCDA